MRYKEINENKKDLDSIIISKLDNYINDDYYMSYTVIDKLGINPRSTYDTPVGIYCYPIVDSILNDIKSKGKMDAVPYMGEAPYIWIFKPKDIKRGLYLSEYSKDKYSDDVEKLRKYVVDERGASSRAFDIILDRSKMKSKKKDYNSYIWNFTRLLSKYLSEYKKNSKWRDTNGKPFDIGDRIRVSKDSIIINKIGTIIDIMDDYGVKVKLDYVSSYYSETLLDYDDISVIDEDSYIEYNEFMKSKKFDEGDIVRINDFDKDKDWYVYNIDWFNRSITLKSISNIRDHYETISFEEFYEANPEYNPSVNESIILEYEKSDKVASSSVVIWSYLLYRVLGYDFVDDSWGYGIIHDNEPTQAVFFNRAAITVSEQFINPSSMQGLNPFAKTSDEPSKFEKIDQNIITKWVRYYLKNNITVTYTFPRSWEKSIPIKSSKLQAQMIFNDINWMYFIKNINSDAIKILDKKILNVIRNLDYKNINASYLKKIWEHFNTFHKEGWPEGETELLNKIKSDRDMLPIIYDYILRVRLIRWPEAEPYILKSPSNIVKYARYIIKDRWPEGETALINMYSKSNKNPSIGDIISDYLNYFDLKVDDIYE
ncbi:MAG: hypothetical protein ACOCRK_05105 [bacterium]